MDSDRELVISDCEELLMRFKRTESIRFEQFSKIWREMKFPDISCGMGRHVQRAFSRLVLDTASCYFMPPFNFQIRVGALYLLFSLFHCQNLSPPEQIRLALKDWEEVKKFEKDALDAWHMDVIFILRQLFAQKAFHLTAMPTLLAFKKQRKVEHPSLCRDFTERVSRPQTLINGDLLEELLNIHEIYEKHKAAMAPSLDPSVDSSMNLIRKDLVPQLRTAVLDFQKYQQQWKPRYEDDGEEGMSSQQECSARAGLLLSIKSKAFGQAAEASRSRRHRPVELNVTSESDQASARGSSKKLKPSLRARTKRNVHISSEVWKETLTTTSIHQLSLVEPSTHEDKSGNQEDVKS